MGGMFLALTLGQALSKGSRGSWAPDLHSRVIGSPVSLGVGSGSQN